LEDKDDGPIWKVLWQNYLNLGLKDCKSSKEVSKEWLKSKVGDPEKRKKSAPIKKSAPKKKSKPKLLNHQKKIKES
jgi:hypothetical protein